MKTRIMVGVLISLVTMYLPARAADPKPLTAAERFEQIKKLAGDWAEKGKDGAATEKKTSYRVTSGGSAVIETIFPGSEKEMITMYHLDGDKLILKHYCMLGNQPCLSAESSADAKKIRFNFLNATNMKSEKDLHMHQVEFTIVDQDHLIAEWGSCQDGNACKLMRIEMIRLKK